MPVNPALYNGVIPQSGDLLSISQGQLLNNFGAIQSLIDTDHVDFASGTATAGQHDRISFTVQTSPPAQNLPNRANWVAGQVGMYSSLNGTTSQNELYINKTNQATVTQIPATASNLSAVSAPSANTLTWSYLPSGLLIQSSGFQGTTFGGINTINTNTAGAPNFNQILQVMLTPWNSSTAADLDFTVRLVDIPTATTFRVYVSKRTTTGAATGQAGFKYVAIGY